jgi:putative ATPase
MEVMSMPLAHKLKPKSIGDIIGQEHILGTNAFLRRAIERDNIPSMIFYGPPGCGKTSLAFVIASTTKSHFKIVNAVSSGIKDLREVIAQAKNRLGEESLFKAEKTILFIDEIHRFNKKQQDYLLPFVERGIVTLIGATTENPSFEVNSALLSRSQVFVLKKLNDDAILEILKKGIERYVIEENGESKSNSKSDCAIEINDEVLRYIATFVHGDARFAINTLEQLLVEIDSDSDADVTQNLVRDIMQSKAIMYDKDGEEHYNIISALHKSMRDGDADASVYWTMRMVEGGEDPKYIVRRMIRFASEDIGNADPEALNLAIATKDVVMFLGYPECDTALVQLAVYLAKAEKDNSAYVATIEAKEDIKKFGALDVPLHLRNADTKLMRSWGYGDGYKYAHNEEGAVVEQEHLPEELKGKKYYKNSFERKHGDESDLC